MAWFPKCCFAIATGILSLGVASADGLWFCADFDSPAELDGTRFEQDMREGAVVEGRFGNGYRFASDNVRAESDFWRIDDPERLKDFPFEDGAFACWFRLDDPTANPGAFFSFCGFWQYQWAFSPFSGRTTSARGGRCEVADRPSLGTDWHHFAATWNSDALTIYFDGKRVAEKSNPERADMRMVNRAVLRFGTDGDGRPAFGGTMDEIAVFKRALTTEEVSALATGERPIRDGQIELPQWNAFPNAAPPPGRDEFIVHSWGGSHPESLEFRKAIGINCVNVRAENTAAARRLAEAGFWLNLRIENSGNWRKYPPAEIARRVKTLLLPYEGLPNWRMALVNSEVYGLSTIKAAIGDDEWRAAATAAMSHAPETAFHFAPPSLDYAQMGCSPFTGVLPTDCTSLNTLEWYLRDGDPIFRVNTLDVETIHAKRPDVIVWSEPTPPAHGLDMLSDWIYDYGTDYCLLRMRQFDAKARGEGVRFMPSLSGSYHHSWTPEGRHPSALDKDGKPQSINLAQSCDETMIKAWMLLGATKSEAMSIFNAGAWEIGMTNALMFAVDATAPVKQIAEPDFAHRFGRFMREKLLPEANQLKGLPTARAKLAFICVDDCSRVGTEMWRPTHYRDFIGTCLARSPVTFDVITEAEMRPNILSHYKYVILPMLGDGITQAHYDALCAVSNTTKVITDGYCSVDFPNVERLDVRMPYWWTCRKEPLPEVLSPLVAWLDAHTDELRKDQFAWSDRDGKDAFTFVKELPDGGKVVLVVNDRREDRSLWPQFCTDTNYRAIAAPNRVTLHVNLPDGEKMEMFDLAPAEARILEF